MHSILEPNRSLLQAGERKSRGFGRPSENGGVRTATVKMAFGEDGFLPECNSPRGSPRGSPPFKHINTRRVGKREAQADQAVWCASWHPCFCGHSLCSSRSRQVQ